MGMMGNKDSWDFRDEKELAANLEFNKEGYIVEKADLRYLNLLKKQIETAYFEFANKAGKRCKILEDTHQTVSSEDSNDLRLYIMQKIFQSL